VKLLEGFIRWIKDNIIRIIALILSLGGYGALIAFIRIKLPLWTVLSILTILAIAYSLSKYAPKEEEAFAGDYYPDGGFDEVMPFERDDYIWKVILPKKYKGIFKKHFALSTKKKPSNNDLMGYLKYLRVEGPYCKEDMAKILCAPSFFGHKWECPTCNRKKRKQYDEYKAGKSVLEDVRGEIRMELFGKKNHCYLIKLREFLGLLNQGNQGHE